MLLSFITPTAFIAKYGSQSDFILALSHLIELEAENEYEKAIKLTNLPIYLDNGLFENHIPEGIDSLLNKAKRLNVEYFFAPDHLYDYKRTKQAYENTDYIKSVQNNNIKMAVVVQAKTRDEYLHFYKELCQDNKVSLIGLSILSIPYCYKKPIVEARIALMQDMLKINTEHKKCHLLGQGSSQADLVFAKENCPWIQSNDSCVCFQSGVFGKKLTKNLEIPEGKVEEKLDFDLKALTKKQIKDIQYNINISKAKFYESN